MYYIPVSFYVSLALPAYTVLAPSLFTCQQLLLPCLVPCTTIVESSVAKYDCPKAMQTAKAGSISTALLTLDTTIWSSRASMMSSVVGSATDLLLLILRLSLMRAKTRWYLETSRNCEKAMKSKTVLLWHAVQ